MEARFEPDHGHWACHGALKVDSACCIQWEGESSTSFGWVLWRERRLCRVAGVII